MEALSIAASVLGILSVTAKLATGLTELVERGKNVPNSVHSLVSELNDIRSCLVQLQPFLQDTQKTLSSRTAMISLDQVITINTSCVLTLSELEKFIDSFKNRQSLSRMDRLRWLKNESRVDRMLLRIRASKSSLNLILVILTCVSMQEARTAIDSLVPAVEGIRTSSQDVSRRLAALEQSAHHLSDMDQHQDNEQHSEIATNAGSSRPQNNPGHKALSGSAIPTATRTDESGMSTLVKQMQIAYAPETITATNLETVRSELFSNLVAGFQITLEMISENEWQYETTESTAAANDFHAYYELWQARPRSWIRSHHCSRAADWPLSSVDDNCLSGSKQLILLMEILWRDPTFQKALGRGHEYAQYDNIYYCFRHRQQLFLELRAISIDDFLQVRTMTRHITEQFFETTNYIYHVIDVDGHRPGRKQWNQLTESIMLFEALLSISYLKATPVVLIFNKVDIFMQQIQEHPLRKWFPDFVGRDNDLKAAREYIQARFTALKKLDDQREIRVYYAYATNIMGCQAMLRDIEEKVMPLCRVD
ncbi:MAG: hypothetical protein Q9226_007197 [Calogaya cf. arnoldii]